MSLALYNKVFAQGLRDLDGAHEEILKFLPYNRPIKNSFHVCTKLSIKCRGSVRSKDGSQLSYRWKALTEQHSVFNGGRIDQ